MSKELSPHELALKTYKVLAHQIESKSWKNAQELFQMVKLQGQKLMREHYFETPVINIYMRVLRIIREGNSVNNDRMTHVEDNLAKALFRTKAEDPMDMDREEIYESIREAMDEIKMEIRQSEQSIEMQALQHLHTNEVVMTVGHYKSVLSFLLYAAKNRKLTVLVAMGSPSNTGLLTAEELRNHENISVELLPDTHIFACMPRVNKVVVGCDAVYSDGTFRATLGVNTVVMAAQTFRVPVCVCFANYKLSPLGPTKHERLSQDDVSIVFPECPEFVEVISPKWDFISYRCFSLLITNIKNYDDPINLFHLNKDSFHRDDVLELKNWMKENFPA